MRPSWPLFLQAAQHPPYGRSVDPALQQVVMIQGIRHSAQARSFPDGESIKGSQDGELSTFGESLPPLGLMDSKKRYFHSVQAESLVYSIS